MFPLFALQNFEWAQKFAHWFNFFINLHCETITFYGTVNEHTTQEGPSKHELPRGIGRETQTQSVENGVGGLSCWVVQREMFEYHTDIVEMEYRGRDCSKRILRALYWGTVTNNVQLVRGCWHGTQEIFQRVDMGDKETVLRGLLEHCIKKLWQMTNNV